MVNQNEKPPMNSPKRTHSTAGENSSLLSPPAHPLFPWDKGFGYGLLTGEPPWALRLGNSERMKEVGRGLNALEMCTLLAMRIVMIVPFFSQHKLQVKF